jgi:hypothetical protein
VLQENIIVRFERGGVHNEVTVSTSHGPSFEDYSQRVVAIDEVVKPEDTEKFIHGSDGRAGRQ